MPLYGEDHPSHKLKERDVILLRTVKLENYHRTQTRIMQQRDVTLDGCTLARLGYTWKHLNRHARPRRILES